MSLADWLSLLLRLQATVSLAILAVLALRKPIGRRFGPDAVWGLWGAAPWAAAACALVPPPTAYATPIADAVEALAAGVTAGPHGWAVHAVVLAQLWLAGAALVALVFVLGQASRIRKARKPGAAPIVIGALSPRIVAPKDFEVRASFEARERFRLLARARIARWTPRIEALIVLAQALSWFNPLAHVAARLARRDQARACDAYALRPAGERPRQAATIAVWGFLVIVGVCAWAARPGAPSTRVVGLPSFAVEFNRRPAQVGPPAVLHIDAAARLIVLPEPRKDIAVQIRTVSGAAPSIEVDPQGAGVLVQDRSTTGRPAWLGGLDCRRLDRRALPTLIAHVPLRTRIIAKGAVFGDIPRAADLALSNHGCGDWRIGRVTGVLALANHGSGSIRTAGGARDLGAALLGSGPITIDGGGAINVDLESAGSGRLAYAGSSGRATASAHGRGAVEAGLVYARIGGVYGDQGRICFSLPSEGRTCLERD